MRFAFEFPKTVGVIESGDVGFEKRNGLRGRRLKRRSGFVGKVGRGVGRQTLRNFAFEPTEAFRFSFETRREFLNAAGDRLRVVKDRLTAISFGVFERRDFGG